MPLPSMPTRRPAPGPGPVYNPERGGWYSEAPPPLTPPAPQPPAEDR